MWADVALHCGTDDDWALLLFGVPLRPCELSLEVCRHTVAALHWTEMPKHILTGSSKYSDGINELKAINWMNLCSLRES
jgi:hypothetical protein